MSRLKNNTVKGNRSQAEQIVVDLLRLNFKKLVILTNDKTAIGKELDIFLPTLKIGIEIDGIFHQQPIFGADKLKQIQANDLKKSKKCELLGITLYRITLPNDSRNYYTFLKEEVTNRLAVTIKNAINLDSSNL